VVLSLPPRHIEHAVRCLGGGRFPAALTSYESGHVPVGQLEFVEEDVPDRAVKVEKSLSVSFDPHSSHGWAPRALGFSRNVVT